MHNNIMSGCQAALATYYSDIAYVKHTQHERDTGRKTRKDTTLHYY